MRISLSQRRHQGSVFPDLPLAAEPVADPIACRCDSNATAAPVCADCSQPLLQAIARKTQHAGRTTLSVSSTHGEQQTARRAYLRIARFFAGLRAKAEQLDAVQRWYRILSEALRKYLRGRQLIPPARLQPG